MSQILSQILLYVSQLGRWLNQMFSSVSTGGLNYNWLVVLFFIFAVFLIGFTLGRTRMLLALVAIYAAAFIENRFVYFPQTQAYFKSMPDYWIHIGLFVAVYIIVFGILNRSVLKGRLVIKEASVFAISLEAILIVGLAVSIILTYLPANQIRVLPTGMLQYFTTKNAQFVWAILPLVLALFLRARKSLE